MQASFEELDAGRHEFPFSLRVRVCSLASCQEGKPTSLLLLCLHFCLHNQFPNVNYPPSIDDPPGFSIRFIWTAHVDGAGGQPGFSSKRYVTPYRPLIGSPPGMCSGNMPSIFYGEFDWKAHLSTPDKEWVYRTTLNHDKKAHPLVQLQAKLKKQAYCPGKQHQR